MEGCCWWGILVGVEVGVVGVVVGGGVGVVDVVGGGIVSIEGVGGGWGCDCGCGCGFGSGVERVHCWIGGLPEGVLGCLRFREKGTLAGDMFAWRVELGLETGLIGDNYVGRYVDVVV